MEVAGSGGGCGCGCGCGKRWGRWKNDGWESYDSGKQRFAIGGRVCGARIFIRFSMKAVHATWGFELVGLVGWLVGSYYPAP